MNILLRILVILTLMLNGVSLWFAMASYAKKNLLIDRNTAFRDFTESIARTFEADEPEITNVAGDHEARDISDVTLATADITPDTSDFWETYKQAYEKIDGKSYAIPNPSDLDETYVLDAEGKPERDYQGNPVTEGSPQANALAEILKKATAQRTRMNNIRDQLTKLREEYEETVADLNSVKKQGRESLKTIQAKEEQIAQLESEKARLEGEIVELKDQISTLENDKQALQADLDKATEELETLRAENEKLKKVIEEFAKNGSTGSAPTAATANMIAGVKGTVVRVNNEYNYCLVKLSDEALKELIGEEGDRKLPEVEYFLRRASNDHTIVGKIRLRSVTKEIGTIVCDILADWKQDEIKQGDEVFFLD